MKNEIQKMKMTEAVEFCVQTAEMTKSIPFNARENRSLEINDHIRTYRGTHIDGNWYRLTEDPTGEFLTEENPHTPDPENVGKLVAFAFYMGCEQTSKDLLEKHNRMISEVKQKPKGRYWKKVSEILGGLSEIYSEHFSQSIISSFGCDKINVKI